MGDASPNFCDFDGNLRPVGQPTDIGARLYGTPVAAQRGKVRQLLMKIDIAVRSTGNGMVDFTVTMEQPGCFRLDLYDMKGRSVWSYTKENAVAGFYRVPYTKGCGKANLSGGIYVISLRQAGMQVKHKITVTRQ